MQGVFFVAACASVLAVALICIFLFANGIPAIKEIGFVKFITGEMWRPSNELFGIFPMIIGSLYVTAGAVIIGVPIAFLLLYLWQCTVRKKNLQTSESGNRTSGGNSFCRIWIFRTCCRCSDHPRFRKSIKRCRTYKKTQVTETVFLRLL